MIFDSYGFVVNRYTPENRFIDKGDSCFRMGLLALIYFLKGGTVNVQHLHSKCKGIDFNRHPTIGETSRDQLLPWHFLSAYSNGIYSAPEFKTRKGKYQWLPSWIFLPCFAKSVLKVSKYGFLGGGHYTYHLRMLIAGTSYHRYKNRSVLKEMQKFAVWYSQNYYNNIFFNWMAMLELGEDPWVNKHNYTDWGYQRDYSSEKPGENVEHSLLTDAFREAVK